MSLLDNQHILFWLLNFTPTVLLFGHIWVSRFMAKLTRPGNQEKRKIVAAWQTLYTSLFEVYQTFCNIPNKKGWGWGSNTLRLSKPFISCDVPFSPCSATCLGGAICPQFVNKSLSCVHISTNLFEFLVVLLACSGYCELGTEDVTQLSTISVTTTWIKTTKIIVSFFFFFLIKGPFSQCFGSIKKRIRPLPFNPFSFFWFPCCTWAVDALSTS